MKLSTKGRYGLKAILDIALYSKEDAIALSGIAERTKISLNYLEQLISKLRKAGLVNSVRGAQGGYRLAKDASEISVGDILRALEGDLSLVNCVSSESGQEEKMCESADICVTRYVWERINTSISSAVDTMMLSELVEQSKIVNSAGNSFDRKTNC